MHSAPHRYNKHFVKRNKHLKVFAPKINFLSLENEIETLNEVKPLENSGRE